MSESLIVVQFSQIVLMGIILAAGINNLVTLLQCGKFEGAFVVRLRNRNVLASSLFQGPWSGVFTIATLSVFIISCLTYVAQDPIMGGLALVSVFGGLFISSLSVGLHNLNHR